MVDTPLSYDTSKRKAPSWYMLAEKRAYLKGYDHAGYGLEMVERHESPRRRWPQAYTRGYWDRHAHGPYPGYPIP